MQRVESKTNALRIHKGIRSPLSVVFRVVNQNPSNAHMNEGYFEVWVAFSLRLARPIHQQLNLQVKTIFKCQRSNHIYNTYIFVR